MTHFFLMLFVLFYLVRDGRQLLGALKALTPLQEGQDERIVARIREMARSGFVGSFVTVVCQGIDLVQDHRTSTTRPLANLARGGGTPLLAWRRKGHS